MTWETVIGLEVHAHLSTKTKLFCACSTEFGGEPNAHTCEVCLGMPGALPVLNATAVEFAVRAGLSLGCDIQRVSEFSRKNYFYPDLPKGYQISQYDKPFALGGRLGAVNLERIHMEEDAGKSVHSGDGSLIDLNRASVPLIEIVSKPDLRSAEQAADYLKSLRAILMAIGVCDGNMEEGSLRCDANVSVRHVGEPLGTRVELKNLNSFKFLAQAINYEVARQREVIESGGKVVQETRLWDTNAKVSRSMRSKEDAHDYRYFPDPDLPPLVLDKEWIDAIKARMPELPEQTIQRLVGLGLTEYDAQVLVDSSALQRFNASVKAGADAKQAANFFMTVVLRDENQVSGEAIAALLATVKSGEISLNIAKSEVWPAMMQGGEPKAIIASRGLAQVSDEGAIEKLVADVVAKNADSVAKYKAGNDKLFGFFVGQVMKASQGKANPQTVNTLLKKHLA